ncbi:hypothetical protein [Clostridium sp.]|uniref:hypothetical protein n=1 Tax=Clostridium sp. TaxID=1506 RepID=UPI0025C3D23D|nr:hypothetical protein [Clostridium sp.]
MALWWIQVSKCSDVRSPQRINCFQCVSSCPAEGALSYGFLILCFLVWTDIPWSRSLRGIHLEFPLSFNINVDEFTKKLYIYQREDEHIIQRIVDKIASEGLDEKEGILKAQGDSYFYYVDWETSGNSAMED